MCLGSFATMDKWAVHRKPSAEAPVNEDVYTEMLGENTEGVFWMQMTEITTVDDLCQKALWGFLKEMILITDI